MTTLTINIPSKSYSFLNDDSVFQSVITETIFDYVEKKQDLETKDLLSKNLKFQTINSKLEEKLWKL